MGSAAVWTSGEAAVPDLLGAADLGSSAAEERRSGGREAGEKKALKLGGKAGCEIVVVLPHRRTEGLAPYRQAKVSSASLKGTLTGSFDLDFLEVDLEGMRLSGRPSKLNCLTFWTESLQESWAAQAPQRGCSVELWV